MPNFDNQDKSPARFRTGARARVLLAAGAGTAAAASFAAAQAGTAAANVEFASLGIAEHVPSSHHSAPRHHSARHQHSDPAPLSPYLLTAGDRGTAVKQVQRAVHRYPTGYFGSGTHKAVARFQHRHHLAPDGVVGPRTRRAMHLRVRIIQPPAPVAASSPAQSPAPATTTTSSTQPTATQSTSSGGYAIPSSVVQCESGGNAHAVSPFTGGGLYGILSSSWQDFGGTRYAPEPYDATPGEQGAIAQKILASQGPGAWQCWK